MQHSTIVLYNSKFNLLQSYNNIKSSFMGRFTLALLCFFLFMSSQISFGQQDSINKKNDSLNASIIKKFNEKLATTEVQRVKDSIKKSDLEKQISSLKTTDNLKKEELQKELEVLNSKEAKRTN